MSDYCSPNCHPKLDKALPMSKKKGMGDTRFYIKLQVYKKDSVYSIIIKEKSVLKIAFQDGEGELVVVATGGSIARGTRTIAKLSKFEIIPVVNQVKKSSLST
jgi:hypothetical protein